MYAILQLFLISFVCLTISAQLIEKTYRLDVTEDVTLERGSVNFNYLQYLIVGKHPNFPLKRSLMKFQPMPRECYLPQDATLHLYFVYAHKASYMTDKEVPSITRYIGAHTVLKSWKESEATSTKRSSNAFWDAKGLNLGTDADSLVLSTTEVQPTPGGKWVEINVIQQAHDWLFGSNYGILLRDTHEKLEGRDFRFASNAYPDSSKHAYITLKCFVLQQRSIGGGRGGQVLSPF